MEPLQRRRRAAGCRPPVLTAVVLLRLLSQCGMDVSAVDFDGWTPLHAAAHWGQADACRILAEKLCNMEARSNAVRSERSRWPDLMAPPNAR